MAQGDAAGVSAPHEEIDALIAGSYLAATNTPRVGRALAALFRDLVSKHTVSRRADADSLEEAGEQLFTFTCRRPRSGRARASSDWARSSRGASRHRRCCPSRETAAMLFLGLLASGQINLRKGVAGARSKESSFRRLTSPPDALFDNCRKALSENSTKLATPPRALPRQFQLRWLLLTRPRSAIRGIVSFMLPRRKW